MGKELRSAERGVKATTETKRVRNVRTAKKAHPVVAQGERAARKERLDILHKNWAQLLMFTLLQLYGCKVKADFLTMELCYTTSRYSVRLPFGGLDSFERDAEKIDAIWNHWQAMLEWSRQETRAQQNARRRQELIAKMPAEDRDLLGLELVDEDEDDYEVDD